MSQERRTPHFGRGADERQRQMSDRPMNSHQTTPYRTFATYGLAVAMVTIVMVLVAPQRAAAQVAALVNGAPITELDVTQRIKLIQLTTHKSASRKEALQSLVDEQLKIFIAKRYSVDASNQEVENAFANMAQRSRISAKQMEDQLVRQGISVSAFKQKVRADMDWANIIRGKFGSSLQISDADLRSAISADADKQQSSGKIYTLYPITFVAPSGAPDGARQNEAENLRSRFTSCDQGLKLARVLRGVVVRDPIKQSSDSLAPQLREILDKMEIGHLTAPEVTPQGIQMFALCERDDSNSESGAKRAAREQIFNKRFEAESKKYLEEVRRQAMIEYR
jgi:peptidyl-prolyl cis-trans isomerase SurA